jgi:hypothetical protein
MILLGGAMLLLAACGGGGGDGASKARTAGNDVSNVENFCRDYRAAVAQYEESFGDAQDPAFERFASLLKKAQAEAPEAVKGDVTTMVDEVEKATSSIEYEGDLTEVSSRISEWASTNCPAA